MNTKSRRPIVVALPVGRPSESSGLYFCSRLTAPEQAELWRIIIEPGSKIAVLVSDQTPIRVGRRRALLIWELVMDTLGNDDEEFGYASLTIRRAGGVAADSTANSSHAVFWSTLQGPDIPENPLEQLQTRDPQ